MPKFGLLIRFLLSLTTSTRDGGLVAPSCSLPLHADVPCMDTETGASTLEGDAMFTDDEGFEIKWYGNVSELYQYEKYLTAQTA